MTSDVLWAHEPRPGRFVGGAGVFAFQTEHPEVPSRNPVSWTPAVFVEADLSSNGGLEIGIFFPKKVYHRRHGQSLISERIQRAYITFGYRHWWISQLSTALAIFSSYSMGETYIVSDSSSIRNQVNTSARDITEYGADLSLQWEFYRWGLKALVADLRHSYSVTGKSSEYSDHWGFFLAYKADIEIR